MDQGRGGGDRRGYEPARGWEAGGRRGVRCGGEAGRVDHAGAGGSGADDDCDAHGEYAHVGEGGSAMRGTGIGVACSLVVIGCVAVSTTSATTSKSTSSRTSTI